MKDETKENLANRALWVRALFMILFLIFYSIAEFVLLWVVLFQFFATLINGRANERALEFGNNLSVYIYEVLSFQTFNTELTPFPFSPWPNESPGGERWSGTAMNPDSARLDKTDSTEASHPPNKQEPNADPDQDTPKAP